MSIPSPSEFLNAIVPKDGTQQGSLVLATVSSVVSNQPKLIFDGETVVSTLAYTKLASYTTPVANDRVAVVIFPNGTGLVLGKIG